MLIKTTTRNGGGFDFGRITSLFKFQIRYNYFEMEKVIPRIIAGFVIVACVVYFSFSFVQGSLVGSFISMAFSHNSKSTITGDSYELYSRTNELNNEIEQIAAQLIVSDEVASESVAYDKNIALVSEGFDDASGGTDEVLGSTNDSSDSGNGLLLNRTPCIDCNIRDRGGLRDVSDIEDEPSESSVSNSDSGGSSGSSAVTSETQRIERIERIENKKASIEKLNTLVSERHELMTRLAVSNPKLFLESRLTDDVLKKLPRSIQHEVEKPVFLKGFVVPMKDSSYFVTKNQILTLYATDGIPTNSISAIQLSGVQIGSLVVAESPDIKKISPFFMNKRK